MKKNQYVLLWLILTCYYFSLQVLSLSEPASRCLVTAVTSLCSRYPRPMCHALIGPVLEEESIGEIKGKGDAETDYRNYLMPFIVISDLGQLLIWFWCLQALTVEEAA